MESDGLPRRGTTPIVRVDGETMIYFVWVALPRGGCDGLMLRCDKDGNVHASIRDAPAECNPHGWL